MEYPTLNKTKIRKSIYMANLITGEIIDNLPKFLGCKMSNTFFNIILNTNDAVLLLNSEYKLQRPLHSFNPPANKTLLSQETLYAVK